MIIVTRNTGLENSEGAVGWV